jgi:hypothetical protein
MQQLLDKWERLRKSEYLRPDEKLMLNHCVSDLKRFMDHSVDANEMVGKGTAVEWLCSFMLKPLSQWPDDMLEQAKEMEKEQIINTWIDAYTTNMKAPTRDNFIMWANNYYEQTYGGNK